MTEIVEISKAELDILRNGHALLDKLWNDKDAGLNFKKMVRSKLPEAKIPELDTIEVVTKPIYDELEESKKKNKSLEDRLDQWEANQKNAKDENDLQSTLDRVQKDYGFTEEGMKKVKNRMMEKNNPDAESAAAWVAKQEPKAQPVASSNYMPQDLNLYGVQNKDDNFAQLHDPDTRRQWEADQINDILSSPEKYREFGGSL